MPQAHVAQFVAQDKAQFVRIHHLQERGMEYHDLGGREAKGVGVQRVAGCEEDLH